LFLGRAGFCKFIRKRNGAVVRPEFTLNRSSKLDIVSAASALGLSVVECISCAAPDRVLGPRHIDVEEIRHGNLVWFA
jgi:hypothetical protein